MTAPLLERPAATRYRRTLDPLAFRESPNRAPWADEDLRRAPARPESDAPVTTRSRRRSGGVGSKLKLSGKAVIAMIAVAATFCGIVVLSTSAYFTAQTVLPSNGVNPGTVALNTAPSFTLSNVVPLSSTTAQTVTTGSIVNFDVAAGSLETRGTVSVTDLGSSMGNAVLPWLRVAIFDGTTWTTPVAGNTVPATAEFTIAGGATRAMKLRFYLDSAVPDSLQGKAISFTITTRGIQSGAPAGTSY